METPDDLLTRLTAAFGVRGSGAQRRLWARVLAARVGPPPPDSPAAVAAALRSALPATAHARLEHALAHAAPAPALLRTLLALHARRAAAPFHPHPPQHKHALEVQSAHTQSVQRAPTVPLGAVAAGEADAVRALLALLAGEDRAADVQFDREARAFVLASG